MLSPWIFCTRNHKLWCFSLTIKVLKKFAELPNVMRCNKVAFSYSQLFWKDGKFPKSDCNVVLQICPTSKLCIAIIAHWPQFLSCADLRLWCWIQNQHSSVFCTYFGTHFLAPFLKPDSIFPQIYALQRCPQCLVLTVLQRTLKNRS